MRNPRLAEKYEAASYTRYRKRDGSFIIELFMPTVDKVSYIGTHREGNYWVLVKVPLAPDSEGNQRFF